MKIIKIDSQINTVDDVYVLSKRMRGIEKFASTHPVNKSLTDLANLLSGKDVKWTMCGGLSLGLYTRPRGTDDIDIMLPDDSSIDKVFKYASSSFKKTRDHAMVHKSLGVEVELLTASFLKLPQDIVSKAIDTARIVSLGSATLPVVTKEGLIALKLNRASTQDLADIESLLKNNGDIDLSTYNLTDAMKQKLEDAKNRVFSAPKDIPN